MSAAQDLEGKTVIVTGAGRGIGKEEAALIGRLGANVVLGELNPDAAADAAAELQAAGISCVAVAGDVSEAATATLLVDRARHEFGTLDAVVNNAGILRDRTVAKLSEDEWDDVIRVHLRGHFLMTREAVRFWKDAGRGGRLVHTSSTSGLLGNFGQSNYGAAKAGIAAFSTIVAQEVARYGITSNAIAPAARTAMTLSAYGSVEQSAGWDFWDPANVAPFVAWLVSDRAGTISGKVFGVEGNAVEIYHPFESVGVVQGDRVWSQDELSARIPELFDQSGIDPEAESAMRRLRFSMTERRSVV